MTFKLSLLAALCLPAVFLAFAIAIGTVLSLRYRARGRAAGPVLLA